MLYFMLGVMCKYAANDFSTIQNLFFHFNEGVHMMENLVSSQLVGILAMSLFEVGFSMACHLAAEGLNPPLC